MRHRKKPVSFANVVYNRYYYTDNYCDFYNCIFNRQGRCFKRKTEQGDIQRTQDKKCFLNSVENKTPEELRKYFRSDYYVITTNLLPEHLSYDGLFPRVWERKVKLERVKSPTQVEVTFQVGPHEQHATLFLRDLFSYELDNREREYNEEEERLSRYVDFDAIRRNHQPRPTV